MDPEGLVDYVAQVWDLGHVGVGDEAAFSYEVVYMRPCCFESVRVLEEEGECPFQCV